MRLISIIHTKINKTNAGNEIYNYLIDKGNLKIILLSFKSLKIK